MANKINRTDIYPLTTPADDDFVLGTDVSNTTNDPNGETVSFSIAALRGTAQQPPSEGPFEDGDKTKLDGIEAGADVTDTANVTAAGALMDSEVTNLAAVKAFDPADYTTKTSATGSAVLPSGTTAQRDGSPAAGYLRYNSTDGNFEGHDGTDWFAINGFRNEQTFTASGTWTKPAGATFIRVELLGAGGGGASGRTGASASGDRDGGGGGGGGGGAFKVFLAADLGATETVTIGAGGAGGASVSTTSATANAGSNGGNTAFGAHLKAFGGGGAAGNGGAGGDTTYGGVTDGGVGGSANAFGGVSAAGSHSLAGAGGGGGGGGVNSSNVESAGSEGGYLNPDQTGGAGGAARTAGTAGASLREAGGGGGGGHTGSGGAGGSGGIGAGGGGGGGATNGFNSGAGGDGGDGWCRVISW